MTEYSVLNSYSDSGGIVGYSSGVVQSCENTGDVGYPHIGYNIGGIAGRQSGYLAGCKNSGHINGRKEVGGIVGQSEPYLTLDPGREILEELRTELHTLNSLIDKTLDDAENAGDNVSERLTGMKQYVDTAEDSCKEMLDGVTDFVDGNVDIINTVSADITNALDKIAPAADELAAVGTSISEMSVSIGEALEELRELSDMTDAAMDRVRTALSDLNGAAAELAEAARQFRAAVDAFTGGIATDNEPQSNAAANDMKNAAGDLGAALDDLTEAAEELGKALDGTPELPSETVTHLSGDPASGEPAPGEPSTDTPSTDDPSTDDPSTDDPNTDTPSTDDPGTDTPSTDDPSTDDPSADSPDKPSLPDLPIDPDMSVDSGIQAVLDAWNAAKSPLRSSANAMYSAANSLGSAFAELEAAADELDPVSDTVNAALDKLNAASEAASDIGRSLSGAFSDIGDAVRGLTEDGPKEFRKLGDGFREAGNRLRGAVAAISDDAEALNRQLNADSGAVADDLRAINEQLVVISDLVIDAVIEAEDTLTGNTIADGFTDTSDEDISATRQGKVADCANSGAVEGDINVGGIVGALAVEFDLDPESDLTDGFGFGSSYETKAVLQSNVNYGAVTAKKDCAGGAAGRMELGTAFGCENYGAVTSTGGSCAGGIAGYSDGVVRSCWAKCSVSGDSYVGGIAGQAANMRGCRAIATIAGGTEYVGALAGGIAADGVLTGNLFVDTGTAGVDGISYADRAEPVGFDVLAAEENAPEDFITFSVTFTADERTVERIPFKYGSDLSVLTLPEVPEKEGCFGRWEEFDRSGRLSDITVEAVYAPLITIAASEEKLGRLSLALAEGSFTDSVELHAEESGESPPDAEGNFRVLTVTLSGTEELSSVPIRLLGFDGKSADVRQQVDGSWRAVETSVSGQYLLLEMSGMSGVFCITERKVDYTPFIIAGGALLLVIAVVIIVKTVKKRKSKVSVG